MFSIVFSYLFGVLIKFLNIHVLDLLKCLYYTSHPIIQVQTVILTFIKMFLESFKPE